MTYIVCKVRVAQSKHAPWSGWGVYQATHNGKRLVRGRRVCGPYSFESEAIAAKANLERKAA
jgi:hypothetical protein